jgi:hypothetical protein
VTRRVRALAATLACALVVVASRASAWIPEPERAWTAIASSNAASGRGSPLEFPVALIGADGNVAATGRLRAAEGGAARLELTLADGIAEVHERRGADYRVTRSGRPVERAPRLLPPLDLLQATTAMGVAEALRAIGGNPAQVDLGIEAAHDCWVLGGRDPGAFEANTRPSLWVDQETQQPVRIDDANGAQYRFGDSAARPGGVRFPSRIDVQQTGWPIWRIQIQGAAATAVAP